MSFLIIDLTGTSINWIYMERYHHKVTHQWMYGFVVFLSRYSVPEKKTELVTAGWAVTVRKCDFIRQNFSFKLIFALINQYFS